MSDRLRVARDPHPAPDKVTKATERAAERAEKKVSELREASGKKG